MKFCDCFSHGCDVIMLTKSVHRQTHVWNAWERSQKHFSCGSEATKWIHIQPTLSQLVNMSVLKKQSGGNTSSWWWLKLQTLSNLFLNYFLLFIYFLNKKNSISPVFFSLGHAELLKWTIRAVEVNSLFFHPRRSSHTDFSLWRKKDQPWITNIRSCWRDQRRTVLSLFDDSFSQRGAHYRTQSSLCFGPA